MPRRKKEQYNEDQLHLVLPGDKFQGSMLSNGLISEGYITRHLAHSAEFSLSSDIKHIHNRINNLRNTYEQAMRKRGEAFTCSTYIEPILDELGWHRIPQQSLPEGIGTRKRPDYCLFTSEQAFLEAGKSDASTLFKLSSTVLEAKQWNHPLDRLSEKETPGWFPSQQIQDYLNHAKDYAGNRYFNWAILTNGAEWRLYSDRAAIGSYFAFHLVRDGQICSLEDFQIFFTLFRATAFDRTEDGLCFLDNVREQSLRVQADLENNLRKRIFGVLEDLGSSFVVYEENHLDENDFPKIYEKSLIFLYRLLFILYAESRRLLPVHEHVPGANRRYLKDFSLARLTNRLRDRSMYQDNAFCGLYEELRSLFNLINGTHPRQNKSLGVTRYNGGLFNPLLHKELEEWRIGDKYLADVLRQLIFAQPPARSRQAQGQLSTDESIDYSTLEVRQLGDIYEGLLGAHFEQVDGRLELRNQNGENHRHGIYYTPDWIVQFLIRETLTPILKQIENTDDVKRALSAHSEERKRDNSFALGVLGINLVDPAMGSGHFLVRATEWLAEQIMNHPTTQPMTIQIISHGERTISRNEIIDKGKIPVSPGIPQEQAEKAYWRRRVVEACIHGVDINPMAVELAKLSLWLTCIAVDEPLNFLDHHLRHGNALLSVNPNELEKAPILESQTEHGSFNMGECLPKVLADVIHDTLAIESTPSTEMEAVKEKENLWKTTREQLKPFSNLSDIWLAALDGVQVDEFNYLTTAKFIFEPQSLSVEEKRKAQQFIRSIADLIETKKKDLLPFHWQLEFPDVFFDENGLALPPKRRGFDAVLGNPPYVSIHTAMESGNRKMRDALEKRAGYLEDLYVHFTDLGFRLLRENGGFGFIVSDTFFTLASKLRMREILQKYSLDWLGQCDPFDATVDAAIFVARKQAPDAEHRFHFVQARPLRRSDGTRTKPEKNLENLPLADNIIWRENPTTTSYGDVKHTTEAELRVHYMSLSLNLNAHKRVFFEPRSGTLKLFDRFNAKVKELVAKWWDKIENSRVFSENSSEICDYHQTLRPGDITLLGLIAEGGQGLATANNARFLGYLEGTPQAQSIEAKSLLWSRAWLADERISPVFKKLLQQGGGDPEHPTDNWPAWELAVHGLREKFKDQQLGFKKTDLFRIVPVDLVATEEDFAYSFQCRKQELLDRWRNKKALDIFWKDIMEVDGEKVTHSSLRSGDVSNSDFCRLCQHLQIWITSENNVRKSSLRISSDILGLHSSENYSDPTDAPRIATIYNGLYGRAQFVSFKKGDPEGSRWLDNQPLFIDWSHNSVNVLSTSKSARWQGCEYFLSSGVSWTRGANHVPIKVKWLDAGVIDVNAMKLRPISNQPVQAEILLAIMNSDVFSFFLKKFIAHTWMAQISDLRMMPLPIPSNTHNNTLKGFSILAISAKRHEFAGTVPDNDLVSHVRTIGERLRNNGPAYLCPSAQGLLLATPSDCLEIIEKAVNWEAEKLYGVEGLGPFDEF